MKGLFIINLKTYKFGNDVLKLAKVAESVDKKIILAAQPTDISMLSKNTKLKIISQHVDFCEPGRNTGYITPESVKSQGAKGVLLNHSEHPLKFEDLKKTVKRCKKLGLETFVFSNNLVNAKKHEKLKVDYIIYEPKELVSTKISVSSAKPKLIKEISKSLKSKVLVGAGIHTNEDIKIALKLGAKGIALSSAITTSKNPKKVLMELLK